MKENRVCAIILAAGSGNRMNSKLTKQRLLINEKSVLFRSLEAFEHCDDITDLILVVREDEMNFAISETDGRFSKLRKIVRGGETRFESARNGFSAIDFPCQFVAVHDAARCLILPEMISKVVEDARIYGAASASSRVVDTVKRVDSNGFSLNTENREELRLATTPQIFKYELYEKALAKGGKSSDITDDNMLMERIGVPVYMTDIGSMNIKITYAEDLVFAEYILERRNG